MADAGAALRCDAQVTGEWSFGRPLCHIIPMVFGVIVYASTLSLTVIAVDRFALIVVGVKRRLSPTVAAMLGQTSFAVHGPILSDGLPWPPSATTNRVAGLFPSTAENILLPPSLSA